MPLRENFRLRQDYFYLLVRERVAAPTAGWAKFSPVKLPSESYLSSYTPFESQPARAGARNCPLPGLFTTCMPIHRMRAS